MTEAVLLTGCNLGDARAQLAAARRRLGELAGRITAASTVRLSAPWGFEAEQPFLNQALVVETPLAPEALLDVMQRTERELGRDREAELLEKACTGQRYASRAMDIDLILYGDEVIRTPRLTVPHPAMCLRAFVLEPLCEVIPLRRHPESGRTMRELLERLNYRNA